MLHLRRNLGHQRAIAIGLSHLHEQDRYARIVIMDGDGEDAESDEETDTTDETDETDEEEAT